MYFLEKTKEELAAAINKIISRPLVLAEHFVLPPDPKLGDVSLPCFALAKEMGENPGVIAQNIAEILPAIPLITRVQAAGPYLNITFSAEVTSALVREVIKNPKNYGVTTLGKKKRVMLEYANGNTHKEVHIGHLRNIAYGDAVNRILAANGYTAIPVAYINDFGIHAAKTLWHFLKSKAKAPKEHKGIFLGQLYAAAVTAMGDGAAAKAEVGEVMKAIESKKGAIYSLWKQTRRWSLDQWKEVSKELGVQFTTTFYESDFIAEGLRMVKTLQAKGILIPSQGAIIADLEQYNLGVLVVIRSDGTALYPVADLSLTFHKVKKFRLDSSLWVIDIRQSQYINQLFKVLELAGLKAHLAHLPYEVVKLPSGMMSSRSGNIIAYEDLKQQTIAKAIEETMKRHAEWTKKKAEKVARVLAFGALKFEMIKVSGEKMITFDIESALRFEGFTAAYLQYTYARIKSIKRKAPAAIVKMRPAFSELSEERERRLAVTLGRFSEIIAAAGKAYEPSEVARYVYELAQLFNDYYHGVPILNDKSLKPSLAAARLQLAEACALVIKRGLELLGVDVVEEM